jgi:hypothetical protein
VAGEVRYCTLEDAARILRLYPDRVREMLEDGEIEGTRTGDTGGWRIPLRGDPDVPPPPVEATTPPPPTEPTPRPAPEPPNEDRGSADEALEEARQPAKLPRGDDAKISGEISSEVTS